jgi:death-on-curing protein
VIFLDLDDVIRSHEIALETGGLPGIRDMQMLESAVAAGQNRWLYQGQNLTGRTAIALVAATYLYHLSQNHGFNDANKRTALIAMWTFVEINDWVLDWSESQKTDIPAAIARGELKRHEVEALIDQSLKPLQQSLWDDI